MTTQVAVMTQEWTRSLPNVGPETEPYWSACREGKLIVQRCRQCSKYQTYYRSFCCHCWSNDVEDVVASGRGNVWACTVTYQNQTPGWADQVPYVLAGVELEEGPKLITNIINCVPDSVHVGMPVKVTFVKATEEITIPFFEPQ